MKQNVLISLIVLWANSLLCAQSRVVADSTFGQEGHTTITGNFWSNNLMIGQPDGKLVVYGTDANNNNNNYKLLVCRLLPNGLPDNSFAAGGVASINFGSTNALKVVNAYLDQQGKILILGTRFHSDNFNNSVFLARFLTNGTADPGFGQNGVVTIYPGFNVFGPDLNLRQDGSICVASISQNKIEVQYLLENGNPDPANPESSFSPAGIDHVSIIKLVSTDSLLVLGTDNQPCQVNYLRKYTLGGAFDPTFNPEIKSFHTCSPSFFYGISTDQLGRVVLTGDEAPCSLVVRFNPDGSTDSTFNRDGYFKECLETDLEVSNQLVFLPEGNKLVIRLGPGFGVARLNDHGTLDLSFDHDGIFDGQMDFLGFAVIDIRYGLFIQPDHKIVMSTVDSDGNLYVARFMEQICSP